MLYPNLTGTNTLSQAMPVGPTQRLTFVHCLYTASATVGNRIIVLGLLAPDDTSLADWHSGANIVANATNQHIEFMPGIYRETGFIGSTLQVPFPTGLIIPPTYKIQVYDKAAISANDSMTVTIQTEAAYGQGG